jgi:hypothetical protein
VKIIIEIYKEKYCTSPKIVFKDSYTELDSLNKISLLSSIEKEVAAHKKEVANSYFKSMTT